MNSDDAELRTRSRLDDNGNDIRTPITIDIRDYPRRPGTKFLEFVDGISAYEIDGGIEKSEARQSGQRLLKKRRQRWLIDSHCAQEDEGQVLHFRFAGKSRPGSTTENAPAILSTLRRSLINSRARCGGRIRGPEAVGHPAAVAFRVLDVIRRLTPRHQQTGTLARGTPRAVR
jgi:hypothetical protein